MADDEIGGDAANAQRCIQRERRRDERRLLHLGVHELFGRRVEAERLQVEAGGLGALVVHGHCLGNRLGHVLPHAGLEGALSWEHECDLRHGVAPVV